jgi:hypothetical protein
MTHVRRALMRFAIVAVGAIVLAGGYAETHRAPDQP